MHRFIHLCKKKPIVLAEFWGFVEQEPCVFSKPRKTIKEIILRLVTEFILQNCNFAEKHF